MTLCVGRGTALCTVGRLLHPWPPPTGCHCISQLLLWQPKNVSRYYKCPLRITASETSLSPWLWVCRNVPGGSLKRKVKGKRLKVEACHTSTNFSLSIHHHSWIVSWWHQSPWQEYPTGNGGSHELVFPCRGETKTNAILENPAKTSLNSNFIELVNVCIDSTPNFLFPAKAPKPWSSRYLRGGEQDHASDFYVWKASCPSVDRFKGPTWSNLLNNQMFAIIRNTSLAVTISLFSSIQSQREFT